MHQRPQALRSGAIAQTKVAASISSLKSLEKAISAAQLAGRWRDADVAISGSL